VVNERNVAALTAGIARVLASPDGWRAMAEPAVMARELVATCGALVPSALTLEEARDAIQSGIDLEVDLYKETPYPETTREPFVRELERIAKRQAGRSLSARAVASCIGSANWATPSPTFRWRGEPRAAICPSCGHQWVPLGR